MKYAIVIMVLLGATRLFAQDSKVFAECNTRAGSQRQMDMCAIEEFKRADAELEIKYRDLSADATNDRLAIEKVKAMRAAWLAFREAYIEAMYPAENKQLEYGTMFVVESSLVRSRLTRQQTAAVVAILEERKPR